MIEWVTVHCPYCDEPFETAVDCSVNEHQEYVEDCQICCQPIVFSVLISANNELLSVEIRPENP